MNYLKKILKDNYNRFAGKFADDLYITTDGIGTKTKYAIENDYFDNLPHDIVNHCINDLLAEFAMPKYFCAYLGLYTEKKELIQKLIEGIDVACKENAVDYLTGETAIMDCVYQENQFEIVGTMIGRKFADKCDIQDGDMVVAIESNGLHTNGFTAVRDIGPTLYAEHPEINVCEDLLCAHSNYYDLISYYFNHNVKIKQMCHITGGSWLNMKRILPSHLDFDLKPLQYQPKIFNILSNYYIFEKLYTTFNCGAGFAMIVNKNTYESIKDNSSLQVMGKVIKGSGKLFIDGKELV